MGRKPTCGHSFVSNPRFDLPMAQIMIPEPPYPCVRAYESREDAYDRYLLALAEHNAKYGTAIEPVTDCW